MHFPQAPKTGNPCMFLIHNTLLFVIAFFLGFQSRKRDSNSRPTAGDGCSPKTLRSTMYTRRNTLCLRWAGPGRRQDNRRRQVRHIAVIQPAGLANRTGEPIRRAAALLGPIELLPTGNERHNALLYGKCLRMDLATRRPGRKHLRIRL